LRPSTASLSEASRSKRVRQSSAPQACRLRPFIWATNALRQTSIAKGAFDVACARDLAMFAGASWAFLRSRCSTDTARARLRNWLAEWNSIRSAGTGGIGGAGAVATSHLALDQYFHYEKRPAEDETSRRSHELSTDVGGGWRLASLKRKLCGPVVLQLRGIEIAAAPSIANQCSTPIRFERRTDLRCSSPGRSADPQSSSNSTRSAAARLRHEPVTSASLSRLLEK